VLSDRGYGYWTIAELVRDDFGYPTAAVVAPDLELLDVHVGFSDWSVYETMIRDHAER